MNTVTLRAALALSLLVNLGVVAAVGYRSLTPTAGPHAVQSADPFPGLAHYLSLSTDQQHRWREAEDLFAGQLAHGERAILAGRNRLLDELFAATPDAQRVEAERAALARLQDERQRLVIEQLQREREILDATQRRKLVQLLRDQPAGLSGPEQLHRN